MTDNVSSPQTLRDALDFRVSELWRYDLKIGLMGGILTAVGSGFFPDAVAAVWPPALGLGGVVLGVVVALIALQSAFLDTHFLRRLELIGREPVHYLAPALFTAVLAVVTSIAILATYAVTAITSVPVAITVGLSFVSGLFLVWTLVSVLPTLQMIISFIAVKRAAASIDDADVARLRKESRSRNGHANER